MTRSVRAILQVDSLLDAFNEEYPDEYKAADIRRLCRAVDCGDMMRAKKPRVALVLESFERGLFFQVPSQRYCMQSAIFCKVSHC
jgi:hypothetical protein